MSTHRGVSCDKCGKSNFSGKRYKCLLCFDFDLCADCYDSLTDDTTNSGRHSSSHPVQCILTRSDISLYYGDNSEHDYSFTCPYCALPGYTQQTLHDHVNTQHADQRTEVVCPICAALPDGDANFVSDDFPEHLAIEHPVSRDTDESSQRLIRRIHQRGGRMKGYHRLYPSSGAYQGNTGSLFNSGYLPRKERASGYSHQHAGDNDPLADLLSQLTTSHRDNVHSAGIPNMDFNEDRFGLSRQHAEYNKYSFNQFSDKPSTSEAKNTSFYKSLTETHTGKGGREKLKELRSEMIQPVPHKEVSAQIKEMSKESEEKKEAFDLKRARQSVFLTELLISSLSEDFNPDEKYYSDDTDSPDA